MKYILYVTFDNKEDVKSILHDVFESGHNGTVLQSTSVRHLLDDDEISSDDPMFIGLRHLNEGELVNSCFAYFILDEKGLNDVRDLIRSETKNFTTVKGGMYYFEINNYEGSI
jgi:hypothetical protein